LRVRAKIYTHTCIAQLTTQISSLRTAHNAKSTNSKFLDPVHVVIRVHVSQYVIIHEI
jgi:hypothetical protein